MTPHAIPHNATMSSTLETRPYLTDTDLDDNRLLTLDWMGYLINTDYHEKALTTLVYYEDIEWITPAARDRLTQYLSNIDPSEPTTDHIDAHERLKTNLEQFTGTPFEKHLISLQYIAAITGSDIDDLAHELDQTRKWVTDHK